MCIFRTLILAFRMVWRFVLLCITSYQTRFLTPPSVQRTEWVCLPYFNNTYAKLFETNSFFMIFSNYLQEHNFTLAFNIAEEAGIPSLLVGDQIYCWLLVFMKCSVFAGCWRHGATICTWLDVSNDLCLLHLQQVWTTEQYLVSLHITILITLFFNTSNLFFHY